MGGAAIASPPISFYLDVHVNRAVTLGLRMRGMDVLTAQEDGCAELGDDLLLARASDLGRVLVSHDADLLREGRLWLRENREFGGIVYAHPLKVTIGRMVEDLTLIADATSQDEWRGRIEFLPLGP